ncbi:hypothetical protein PG994_006605 [Apiospora phragmitis]|uniref:Opioid growth factor receptor (OGFr) conserved domain-containing protein n=1 Tax=Apiospora phragmitis TaxID=2905665 RepID=A0ABR1VFH6_9PEZI
MSPQRPARQAMQRLVDFYDPATKGKDVGGRTLDQILGWRDTRLESQHDYIQILFPLPEGSIFNEWAPVIDEETFLYLRQDNNSHNFQPSMRRVLTRMLTFYGFDITWEEDNTEGASGSKRYAVAVTAKPGAEDDCFPRWVRRRDHNHLRISRILRSLRVLGLADEARAFFAALVWVFDTYGRISDDSMMFWRRAVELPLHVAPDGTEVDWLGEYEEKNKEEKN